jgi:hypothetical protein
MFQKIRDALAQASRMDPRAKADLLEKALRRINQVDPGWLANRGPATNAIALFTGDLRQFGLAIDKAGRIWISRDFTQGCSFGPGGIPTIDFSSSAWRLLE